MPQPGVVIDHVEDLDLGSIGQFPMGDLGLPPLGSWTSRLSSDFDRIGFRDDHTAVTRGQALLRTEGPFVGGQLWLTTDLNILRQDPASPHPRVGTELTSAIPVDANQNPSGAYVNANKMAIAAGVDRNKKELQSDLAYLLREKNGPVRVVHDTHVFGIFLRETWLRLLREAGFEPRAVADPWGREVFVCKKLG